jgi:hypothetical protein
MCSDDTQVACRKGDAKLLCGRGASVILISIRDRTRNPCRGPESWSTSTVFMRDRHIQYNGAPVSGRTGLSVGFDLPSLKCQSVGWERHAAVTGRLPRCLRAGSEIIPRLQIFGASQNELRMRLRSVQRPSGRRRGRPCPSIRPKARDCSSQLIHSSLTWRNRSVSKSPFAMGRPVRGFVGCSSSRSITVS